jgi:hypothetical protein
VLDTLANPRPERFLEQIDEEPNGDERLSSNLGPGHTGGQPIGEQFLLP